MAIGDRADFGELRVIGQLANSYIVCEGPHGLLLVDQHAAHERILFEQLAQKAAAAGPRSQALLMPETVELGFREAAALEPMLERLSQLGLSIEPFGGNTLVVKAVPAAMAERDVRPLVTELAEQMVLLGSDAGLGQALDACRMVVACHGAIRAHQRLDERQMSALLGQLDACENPSHCPHGRPTWVRWELAELERMFKRTL
jgi:DNA mismatch repair protein MutL